ncbi:MAG: glycoside hydrolase family 16 [Myxococcaceae bacterium]|nr:glycoside hydrolase family 16 [Myxococcaceae bacterium]
MHARAAPPSRRAGAPDGAQPSSSAQLSLAGFEQVFSEEFEQPPDVSAAGPGTRWTAHTPWNGDFGDARFVDPRPGFPFSVQAGVLRIEARKVTDPATGVSSWQSGLLSSTGPSGQGFALQYGYFEVRAKLPRSKGVWPAFWLATAHDCTDPHSVDDGAVELDVLEFYGFAEAYNEVVHVWKPEPHRAVGTKIDTPARDASTAFHTYGVHVTPDWLYFYRDRREVWRTPTPSEHKRPLGILLNLALGGGFPITEVENPTFFYVDYVRAYRLRAPARAPVR